MRLPADLWEHAPVGVLWIRDDAVGTIVDVNPAFAGMLARDRVEMRGVSFLAFVASADREATKREWARRRLALPSQVEVATYLNHYEDSAGRAVPIEWFGEQVLLDDGTMAAFCRRADATTLSRSQAVLLDALTRLTEVYE